MTPAWLMTQSGFGGAIACIALPPGARRTHAPPAPFAAALTVRLHPGARHGDGAQEAGPVQFFDGDPDPDPDSDSDPPSAPADGAAVVDLAVTREALDGIAAALGESHGHTPAGLPGRGGHDATIGHCLLSLLPMLRGQEAYCAHLLQHVATAVCVHVVAHYAGAGTPGPAPRNGGLAPAQLQRVRAYLGRAFDAPVDLGHAARLCGLSPRHFSRAFQATCGMSPYQYRLALRIEHATALLEGGRCSIADIARQCGFSGSSHFANTFFARTGSTPRAWRERHALRATAPSQAR